MRALLAKRWIWVTSLFAAINIVGLAVIASQVRRGSALLRIEAFEPQGEIDPAGTISVRFSQLMATAEEVGKEVKEELVKLAPTITGRLVWADRMTLAFRPASRLPMATPFVATVSRRCTSLLGHSLLGDAAFAFHTPPLRVLEARQVGLTPYRGLSLVVEFNARVVPEEAIQHIAVRGSQGRQVPISLTSRTPGREVMLVTQPIPEEVLNITVKKGLRCLDGPLGMETDWSQALRVEAGLRITGVSVRARAPDDVAILVACNQPLDLASAAKHITVEPKVDCKLSPTYDGLQLRGQFAPGQRYRLKFWKELAAKNGSVLGSEIVRSVTIPDVEPSIHFRTSGIYLGAQSSMLLPLECVNVREVQLTIDQVYPNNVVHYLRDTRRSAWVADLTRRVHQEKIVLPSQPNERQVKNLDLRKILGADASGAYLISAHTEDIRWGRSEEQLVLITDLALTVKRSELDMLVWVTSLSKLQPVEGATVAVFSKANQQIHTGTTDASGIAHFKGVDWTGEQQPFAVAATKGNDTGVIELNDVTRLDDSELDTGGRPYLAKGYEAFVYTDRGIYRPGSQVALHALVRGKDLEVPQPFPVQFRIQRPDGRPYRTVTAKLNQWGSAGATVEVPTHALTGRYNVEVRLPGTEAAIGTHTFQVEEFMPDRMKVALKAQERRYRAGEEVAVTVRATHLFGAPAADREVEAECRFVPEQFSSDKFPGYRFSDEAKKLVTPPTKIGEGRLNQDGELTFTAKIPKELMPPSAAKVVVTATVKEIGGRAVAAALALDVDCYPHYIGLARASKEYARVQTPEKLLVAALRPDGTPVPSLTLEGSVYRVIWNTVLKLQEGSYRFVSEREERPVESLVCSIADGRGEVAFTPRDIGEHVVRLRDKASGASADLQFYCAGEGDVPWSLDKPARVELVTDKPAYVPGDTARILLKAPFAGKALVTVETDRVHLAQVISLEKNTAEFTFPVGPALTPNAYCSAMVIRKTSPGSQWAVQRAYGAVAIRLDNTSRRLRVELESPEETRPGRPLRVGLRVRDATGAARKAEVTFAAVDEGICQLTRYQTPSPWDFFFGKRALGVVTCDIFSLLMPEPDKRKVGSDSAPGGDGEEGGYDPRVLNPVSVQRVKQVAFWKAGIETGEDGNAEVVIDVPEFTGQLRLMAVAASGGDFGSSDRPVRVKQPLMVQASFPRFLAPEDEFVIPITIFNNTGKSGPVAIKLQATTGISFPSGATREVQVENGREATVQISARAPAVPGPASIAVETRLGDETAVERADLPVRPPTTLQFASGSGSVKAGQSAAFTIPADWVQGTDRYWLSFSPLPTLSLGASLRYLIHYPYGCVEQTVSTVFPLLYLGDVAKVAEPDFDGKELEPFVQAGIDRVFSMQTYRGGFASWPGYTEVYPWGSAYATHFLVEAKKAGYDVPKDNLDAALTYLDKLLTEEREGGGACILPVKAYACFVLAIAGKPNRSWTMRLLEAKDELPAYSRFHVAAALAAMKETALADTLIAAAALPPVVKARDTGDLLHSSAREAAILLSVYVDLRSDHPNVPLLVQRLTDAAKDGRWMTTQENAFALLAMGKYARLLGKEKSDFRAEVTVAGEKLATLTSRDNALLKPKDLGGKEVRVTTQGTGTLYYYWGAEGIPAKETVVERDTSLKARRRFLGRSGAELDPRKIVQGDVVVVELTLDNGVPVKNLVVNDLLPAGLEIENPHLETSAASRTQDSEGEAEDELEPTTADTQPRIRPLNPDRVEMRDDRLILFADLPRPGVWRHRYVVRAVTRGRFKLPPLNAFCMYNPEICSTHGAGTIEITGR